MRVTGTCTETDPTERFALDSRMRHGQSHTRARTCRCCKATYLCDIYFFYALSKVILGMEGGSGLVAMLAPSSNKCPTHRW